MKKISDVTITADKNGEFTDGNVAAGTPPTQLMAAWFNSVQREILNVLAKANIAQSAEHENQLADAIRVIIEDANLQPEGDYATNTALTMGLGEKFDKKGGNITGVTRIQADYLDILDTTNTINIRLSPNTAEGPMISVSIDGGVLFSDQLFQNKSGTLMHVGDYGWGGNKDINLATTEAEISTFIKAVGTPTQVYRNTAATKYATGYSTNAYFKTGDCWFNLSVGYSTGILTLTSGSSTTEKLSTVYGTANTFTDRNGCLRVVGSNDLSDCPVGTPIPWPQATAPAGYIICSGQTFNKTTYPLLAKAYPSGTLPDLRGEFIRGLDSSRGVDASRVVLTTQGDAIRNIKGEHGYMRADSSDYAYASGAFSTAEGTLEGGFTGILKTNAIKYIFDASKVVPTATENRPRNIAFLYIVRAA